MTPPPKHIKQERTVPSLESPSDSFLLSQPLLTAIKGTRPMIHVARPRVNIEMILAANSSSMMLDPDGSQETEHNFLTMSGEDDIKSIH